MSKIVKKKDEIKIEKRSEEERKKERKKDKKNDEYNRGEVVFVIVIKSIT